MSTRQSEFDRLWDLAPQDRLTGGPDFEPTAASFDALWDQTDAGGGDTTSDRQAGGMAAALDLPADATRVKLPNDALRSDAIARTTAMGEAMSAAAGLSVPRAAAVGRQVPRDQPRDATAIALPRRAAPPVIRSEAPKDATLHRLGAARDADRAALQDRYEAIPSPVRVLGSAIRGAGEAVTLGHLDELVTAANRRVADVLGKEAPDLTVDEVLGSVDRSALEHLSEVAGFVGGASSSIRLTNSMLAGLAPAAREGTRLRRVLQSFDPAVEVGVGARAAQGVLEGVPFDLAYDADSPEERARNVALGVGLGAVLGPVVGGRTGRATERVRDASPVSRASTAPAGELKPVPSGPNPPEPRSVSRMVPAADAVAAERAPVPAPPEFDLDVILGERVPTSTLSGVRRDEGGVQLGRKGGAEAIPSKAQIVRDLSDALGVPMRSGRFGGRARGIFKIRSEVIRSRIAGDIENVAHEAGHHLHKVLFGTTRSGLANRPLMRWADELRPLGKGVSDESLSEGYAEFVRRYVTNVDAAEQAAPKFLEYFEQTLEERLPEALNALRQARSDYRAYLNAPAQARIRAQRARPADLMPTLQGSDVWRAIRTRAIDDLTPLRVTAARAGVTSDEISQDVGTLADLARGSAGQAEWMVNEGMIDFGSRTTVGAPLKSVFDPLRDASGRIDQERYEDFMDFAIASRVKYLYESRPGDIGFLGIERADVDRVVSDLGSSEFSDALQRFQAYNDGLLQYLHDAGVLTDATLRAIRSTNEVYVPLMRVMDQDKAAFSGGPSRTGGGNPIRRIRGSGRQIIDPGQSMLERTYQYTRIAAKQQVARAIYEISSRDGMGHLIEELPAPKRVFTAPVREVLEKLFLDDKTGADLIQTLPDETLEEMLMFFRPGDYAGADDVVSVLVDGRRRFFQVDSELYRALEGLDDQTLPVWAKIMGAPARTLRAGATLAPEFIARNPVRDQLMAGVQSEWGYTPFVDLVRGLSSILKKDEYYETFMAGGGARSSLVGLDRKAIRQNLERAVGLEGVVKNPLDMLRALSEVMEDATRVGETRNALGALRAAGTPEGPARLRAAAAARDISVDFARRGTDTAVLRHLSAFWNARLQGYDRLAQAFKRDPQGTTAKAVAYITVPSVLEYMLNREDPEYFEIPRWQRDLFWVFKVGGHWLRVPKPFELGIVFGTLPQRALEWMDTNDPGGFQESAAEFLQDQAYGMAPVPTFALPLIENWANRSQFLQRPIVPRGLEGVDPAEQFTRGTSEVAKGVGRMLGMSPAKVDNTLFAYTGGLGRLATEIVDIGLGDGEATRDDRPPLLQAPAVRGFTVRPPGESSESIDRLYRARERANSRRNTYRKLLREGRAADAEQYFARHEEWIVRSAQLNRIADQLTAVRRSLSTTRSEQERRELAALMTNLAAQALGRDGLQ